MYSMYVMYLCTVHMVVDYSMNARECFYYKM